MAYSSRRSTRKRRETFFGEGNPPIFGEAAMPRGSEDGDGSSNPSSEPTGPVEEVLGRPTVDPWYKSNERFPSIPADPQPSPANWE